LTGACIVVSFDYLKNEQINLYEYSILLMCALLGLMLFVSSFDLISMYLSLELQSLSFYILATLRRDSAFSAEAGLKYFILGVFSTGLLLFGISLIYGVAGTTNFENLSKLFMNMDLFESYNILNIINFDVNDRLVLGMVFLMIGFFFKLAVVPFHMWAPDVYEGSPTPVSLFFALLPKLSLIGLFIRIFFFIFYDLVLIWQYICLIGSLASIIVGTFAALRQYKIKRFLAYSGISHIGFLLLGFSTGSIEGLQSLIFYLLIYFVMTLNIWTVVLSLEVRHNNKNVPLKYITDLQGLGKSNKLLGATFLVTLFSMGGIPPLAGFFAKVSVLFSAMEMSLNYMVVIAILFSIISTFYYIRFIKIIFFDTPKNSYVFQTNSISYGKAIILGVTFYFMLFFFLSPDFLFVLVKTTVFSLFV